MKNLKKVLAFVTMFTMLLSVAVSAGTLYPDVDDNASYVEAVETLNALSIMIGDEKGNFNPDNTITRAEAAAIVTRMKALGEVAGLTKGTKFADVPADHWAAGYVNLAEQAGIINGYGDGNFGPSDPVTYEQMIKMVVAALGYTPEADTKGGYPTGYLIIASREAITKGVSVTVGAEAPRAAVARMAFNALEVPVMEQIIYKDSDDDDREYDTEDRTLLKTYLKVDKAEGVVTDTYLSVGTKADDKDIRINVTKTTDEDMYTGTNRFAEGKANATGLLGNRVVAYFVKDEVTNKNTLLGITKKSGQNSEIAIDYTQIDAYTAPAADADGTLKYFEDAESTFSIPLTIAANAKYFYNGRSVGDVKATVDEFIDDVEAGSVAIGSLTLIDNNRDDVYDVVMLKQATRNEFVKVVDAAAKRLENKLGSTIALDMDDENKFISFYKADGSAAAFEDIKEGDVLTIYASLDNERLASVYISDVKVEGMVSEMIPSAAHTAENHEALRCDDSYVIGEDTYRVAFVGGTRSLELKVGDEGTFYVNCEGRIVEKEAKSVAGNYAYLLNADFANDINGSSIELKYVTADGAVEVASLASKVAPIVDGNDTVSAIELANITSQFAPLFSVSGSTVTLGNAGQRLFQFSKNSSGRINKLFIISNKAANRNDGNVFSMDRAITTDTLFNAATNKLGNMYFNDETIVLNIKKASDAGAGSGAAAKFDEDEVVVTKVSNLFLHNEEYANIEGYDVVDNIPSIVVAYNATAGILETTKGLLVTKISTMTNANGTPIVKLYGLQDGVAVEAEQAEDGWSVLGMNGAEATVEAGDFIIFAVDEKGAISDVQILMDKDVVEDKIAASKESNASVAEEFAQIADYDKTRNIFGFAQKRKAGGLLVVGESWYEGAAAFADAEFGGELALPMTAQNISFYEANLLRNPDAYRAIGFGDIKTETRLSNETFQRVSNWVYIRMYDGEVVDVVVYTDANPTEVPEAPDAGDASDSSDAVDNSASSDASDASDSSDASDASDGSNA